MNDRKQSQLAWAFYDWANSSFAVVVMAGFFPVFFKKYWANSLEVTESTYWLGMANSASSLLIVLLAPLLGALADQLGRRKGFLLVTALLGIVMTGGLSLAGKGDWQLAMVLYLFAVTGFMGANVFYDALLMTVSGNSAQERDRVSILGYTLGYLGGGLLFAFCVLMTQQPQWFNIADASSAVKISFVLVALWWALFTIPVLVYVKEEQGSRKSFTAAIFAAAGRVFKTLRELKDLRMAAIFLAAYWLYIDGVGTVIRMAVDFGMSIGFDEGNLIIALLITQFIGFPATFMYGRLARHVDIRSGIFFGLAVYMLITLWGSLMQSVWEFYALAVIIGLVQGGVQALSRSLFSHLIPQSRASELFGFYNMVGKSAAVIGPWMIGYLGILTGSPRLAILSLLVLFVGGFLLLLLVKVPAGDED